jgi:hypothetical protein
MLRTVQRRWLSRALSAAVVVAMPAAAAAAPQALPQTTTSAAVSESGPATTESPQTAPTPQTATTPGPNAAGMKDMQMPPAGDVYPNLKIVGFGDFDYTDTKRPEGPQGFSEGQFVLHMTSSLSPRVTFFGELSFTARPDAGTGTPPAPGFNVEVERMILRFDKSDKLKVSFGRYHTPINYWNTAFHHGQWLQTTIERPEMIEFGGKFLPVHFVGALVEGAVPASGWNLNYKAGLGNGRGSVISRAGDDGDINGNRAWLVNSFVRPDWAYGLEFGGSYYSDLLTIPTSVPNIGEHIVSSYVAWSREDPEFIAEFAGVRHETIGTSTALWNHAFYIQGAYRLPQFGRLWKPYYRFEHIDTAAGDVAFATIPQLDGSTVGVRYDATQLAAVKFEYRTWTRGPGTPRNYGGFFQICFTF